MDASWTVVGGGLGGGVLHAFSLSTRITMLSSFTSSLPFLLIPGVPTAKSSSNVDDASEPVEQKLAKAIYQTQMNKTKHHHICYHQLLVNKAGK